MDDFDPRMLVDAKQEYSNDLIRILKKPILEGISSIFLKACEISSKQPRKTFLIFQDLLSQIPKWNQELIDTETLRIINISNCDFLEDLITAVFVSHTKILAVIRTTKRKRNINLTIPKSEIFIHKCYIESAREFWKCPELFDRRITKTDQLKNSRYCEDIISSSINETIRKLLPLRYILKESLGDSFDEEDSLEDEDITKQFTETETNNLKKLVQNQLKGNYYDKPKEEFQNTSHLLKNKENIPYISDKQNSTVSEIEKQNQIISEIEQQTNVEIEKQKQIMSDIEKQTNLEIEKQNNNKSEIYKDIENKKERIEPILLQGGTHNNDFNNILTSSSVLNLDSNIYSKIDEDNSEINLLNTDFLNKSSIDNSEINLLNTDFLNKSSIHNLNYSIDNTLKEITIPEINNNNTNINTNIFNDLKSNFESNNINNPYSINSSNTNEEKKQEEKENTNSFFGGGHENININTNKGIIINETSNINIDNAINLDELNIDLSQEPINIINNIDDSYNMKELDISSLVKSNDILEFNNNFELSSISNNSNKTNLYDKLNNNEVIKKEVINNLHLNKDKESIYLFDDAPLME
jgi:hypothetical protein